MKLKNGYTLIEIDGSFKVLSPDNAQINDFDLSEYGAFLWHCLNKSELSNAELLNKLLDAFQISTVLALGEIDTFIKKCKENGILE